MAKRKRKETIEPTLMSVPLDQIAPSPLQARYFSACSVGDDEALRRDIDENGLRDRVVLRRLKRPRGHFWFEILDGHRRVRIAAELGMTAVDAIIRDDLDDADPQMIELEFLKFNFLRRQLTPLERATIARRAFELERGPARPGRRVQWLLELRTWIGQQLGWTGRHLQRMLRILETPPEIQLAIRERHLGLMSAEQVQGLPPEDQQQIAERLSTPEQRKQAAQIVEEFLAPRRKPGRSGRLRQFVRRLKIAVTDLGDVECLVVHPNDLEAVERAHTLLARMIQATQESQAAIEAIMKDLAADMHEMERAAEADMMSAP